MEVKNEDYTASAILTDTSTNNKHVTVEDFLSLHIQQLRENGKVGNSYAYLNLRTTLQNFYGKKLNFLFNVVDVAFCNKFEAWMRKNKFKDTTMHYYFRTLRAVLRCHRCLSLLYILSYTILSGLNYTLSFHNPCRTCLSIRYRTAQWLPPPFLGHRSGYQPRSSLTSKATKGRAPFSW